MQPSITLYGANTCSNTKRAISQLEEAGVNFCYVNVEINPMAHQEVKDLNNGLLKLPTLVLEGHGTRVLTEPNDNELWHALVSFNIVA